MTNDPECVPVDNNAEHGPVADLYDHPIVTTDSRIINLGQLNFQLNKVACHAATCEVYKNNINADHDMMLTLSRFVMD